MYRIRNVKKAASLTAVCLQSTLLAVVLDLSSRKHQGQRQYKASSAVIITELAKLVLSAALAVHERSTQQHVFQGKGVDVSSKPLMDRRQSKATGFNNGLDPNGLISLQRRKSAFTSDSVVAVPQPSGSQQSQLEPSPCPAWPASHLAAPLPDADESKVALLKKVWIQVFDTDLYKMALPAILFSVQNMLIYTAARNLSMAVFQITFQLKSVITALCAVLMLGRRYTPIQWLSLLFLGLGVACIQLAPKPGQNHEAIQIAQKFEWRLLASKPSRSQMTGLLAVVVSCFASAFAATYFEVLLKKPSIATVSEAPAAPPLQMPYGRLSVQLESNPPGKHSGQTFETLDLGARRHTVAMLSHGNHLAVPQVTKAQLPASSSPSLWIKNIQLALFSLLCTTGYNFFASSGSTAAFISSFFDGFNAFTWLVIAIQAVGGLLTALVIKHADNVAKGFALSTSIVLTFVISILCFDYHLTFLTAAGASVVLVTAFTFERYGRR